MFALIALAALPAGFARVEARYVAGQAAISAQVGPGTKQWFVLDTGSPKSVFNGALPQGWIGPIVKIGAYDLAVPTEKDEEFKADLGEKGPFAVAGIFGCDFLGDKQVVFDAFHGALSLRIGGSLSRGDAERILRESDPLRKGRRLAVLPLIQTDDGLYVEGKIGGRAMRWAFDTGAAIVTATKALLEAPGVGGRALTSRTLNGYTGLTPAATWIVPSVHVGPTCMLFPLVSDEGDTGDDGTIGLTQLAWTAVLDLPGKAVYYLEPTSKEDRVDAAIGRIFGAPLRRASDGGLLLDIAPMVGKPSGSLTLPRVVSIQGRSVTDLRALLTRADGGDPKALGALTLFADAQLQSPRYQLRIGGKTVSIPASPSSR